MDHIKAEVRKAQQRKGRTTRVVNVDDDLYEKVTMHAKSLEISKAAFVRGVLLNYFDKPKGDRT